MNSQFPGHFPPPPGGQAVGGHFPGHFPPPPNGQFPGSFPPPPSGQFPGGFPGPPPGAGLGTSGLAPPRMGGTMQFVRASSGDGFGSNDSATSRRGSPMQFVSGGTVDSQADVGGVAASQSSRREVHGSPSDGDDEDLLAPGVSQAFGGVTSTSQQRSAPYSKPWRGNKGSEGNDSWSTQREDAWGSDAHQGNESWSGESWQDSQQDNESWSGQSWQGQRDTGSGGASDRSGGYTPSRGCPPNLRGDPGAPRAIERATGRRGFEAPRQRLSIMMVAEKPAIAQAFAQAAAPKGQFTKENRGSLPTFSFTAPWVGGRGNGPPGCSPDSMCEYHITSSIGHIYSVDFPSQMRNWHRFDPEDLYDAAIVRNESNTDVKLPQHLADEASRCHIVILCLDCDREGEAIGYEALESILPNLSQHPSISHQSEPPVSYQGCDFSNDPRVWRVQFSSLAPNDLRTALKSLQKPNYREARCVDARAEIDLKVGVSLSRLITMNLRDDVGPLAPEREGEAAKHGSLLSYGPCQTPTLGFCVERWDLIQNFEKQRSNTIDLRVRSPSGAIVTLSWQPPRDLITTDSQPQQSKGKGKSRGKGNRSSGFYEPGTNRRELLEEFVRKIESTENPECECESINSHENVVERPCALNTVEMLRLCSRELGIDPQRAMSVAEKLYLGGILTYPRTETSKYPASINFEDVLQEHSAHKSWGSWCKFLMQGNFTSPRNGTDCGDHPPITPVWCASEEDIKRKAGNMGRDALKIYELVTKHFLASVSPDVKYTRHEAMFDLQGYKFALKGNEVTDWGYARLFQGAVRSAQNGWVLTQRNLLKPLRLELAKQLEPGMRLKVAGLGIRELVSSPPQLLTESELLSVMEKEQIGTDASMATHVNNVVTRGYVEVVGDDRRMRPTILGVWLIHGLQAIDAELTQPAVRARIEKDVTEVANGLKSCEDVVSLALQIFRGKFQAVRAGIPTLKDVLQKTKEHKDGWEERAKAVAQQQVPEPPEDEPGAVVAPKPLTAGELRTAKRPLEEQGGAAGVRNVRARTAGGGGGAGSVSSRAEEDDANLTPIQKLRKENKVLATKLAIAELRAENAELKFKEMERKHAEMATRVEALKKKKAAGSSGKGKKKS